MFGGFAILNKKESMNYNELLNINVSTRLLHISNFNMLA